ncbi:hypothetical protein [Beggiatoa leptomitoformis]|uniref:Uncharacterized protein n=1 Tax=Beggiatoa leptomitoformis TaxID=288004 RepID=A0A2N9YDD2_9GAMM|nr:hypothetical protein [Beggiatoa leptomitoformis]ALG69112.1 hypothetical protein AL038_17250 [Beggiatoa leptomitoformis]AUI68474.1 hypothetical protein BLE401_06975 [Beggiatoa leptomitoformis]
MDVLLHASPSPKMYQRTQNPLQIAVLGVDKQARHLLELVFKGPGHGNFMLVDNINLAEAGIFDRDSINAETVWKEYRHQNPHLPTIVLALQAPADLDKASSFVKKPIEIDKLLTALTQLKQQAFSSTTIPPVVAPLIAEPEHDVRLASTLALEQEEEHLHILCGHTEDINPTIPDTYQRVYYNPQNYLQGFFEKAFAQARQLQAPALLLQGFAEPVIILPDEEVILFSKNFTDSKLRTMTLMPLSNTTRLRTAPLAQKELEQLLNKEQFNRQALESFLWKITLWTARGRIPEGTDINKAVTLTHWPNFTRLELTPHAMEITAIWVTQSCTLIETANLLNIRQRYVFALYSAATAIKLTNQEKRTEQIPSDAPATPPATRGLLQRVLSHLRGKL